MSAPAVVDTSVLVDHLRGHGPATNVLTNALAERRIVASVMTKVEVMAGIREGSKAPTKALLKVINWIPVSEEIADMAGDFAQRFAGAHSGIDPVDYVIAATVASLDAELWTRNVRHFPMFPELQAPY